MPFTDPVSSITNCYHLIVSYTALVHSFIISTGSSFVLLSFCLFWHFVFLSIKFVLVHLQIILVHWRSSYSWFFQSHFASSKAMQSCKCGICLDRTRWLFQVDGIQGAPLVLINVFQVGTCVCRDKKLERSSPIGVVPPGAIFPLTGFIEFTKFFNMARCLPHTK